MEERLDELNRKVFSLQIDGSKTANELPGIVDQVITLVEMNQQDGNSFRAFVSHTNNPYNYPAKDRSGKLEMLEPADLSKLMQKIKLGKKLTINTITKKGEEL